MKPDLECWAKEVESLGSLPVIFHQLNKALDDPHSSVDHFGEIIEADPGLSIRLLRIANSSFFGFSSRIATVGEALTLIGLKQMRDLVTATVVLDFFHEIPPALLQLEAFWHHSLACGIGARLLAIQRGEASPERFFLAGLLHDTGRLVMCLKIPEKLPDILARGATAEKTLTEIERESLGTDHAEVGGTLLEHWCFPPLLVETVRCHHAPERAGQFPMAASLVHVADIVAHSLELGASGEPVPPKLEQVAWNRLGLEASILGTLVNELDRQFDDAVSLFL